MWLPPCPISWITCSRRSQLTCCTDGQVAPRKDPHGNELRLPANSYISEPPWKQFFTSSQSSRWWQPHKRLWTRTTPVGHAQIPDPMKPWDNKCLLFKAARFWSNLWYRNKEIKKALTMLVFPLVMIYLTLVRKAYFFHKET